MSIDPDRVSPPADMAETDTQQEEPARSESPDRGDVQQLRTRWREVQGAFVDDPHDAVSRAAELVTDLVDEVTARYQERTKTLAGQWSGGDHADTENLRTALCSYRDLFDDLLEVR
ncbi:MAG: hypothetical protein HOQ24_13100 [Mycobacteriaceae bacterium]|nr:hypothetical protein [Mycobacteriaceae bacterium]